MKRIFEAAFDFLRDRNDGSSYKRLCGLAAFVVAVIIAFTTKDNMTCGLFLGVATAAAGLTVMEK